ncbi:hypothetical protein [Sphingobacterium bovistauri]|uniref:Uncharacterized protein n=1 Tax=Sphingobacterium bovistauri TaxID=2781959 RepID=A0ABS7Z3E9_9SPHI|nr:hypothetical protein [Sphingobacterium bovistauri]MCA5004678.1 hypothetical protein [Sphingobacterium bovistauri]
MNLTNNDNNPEIGLGDLEKTVILNSLLEVPFQDRDEKWVGNFLQSVDEANLKLGSPEVVIASDGFPYIQLQNVKTNENFQAFVINKQLPTILMQGFGIVINAQNERPDWVFSYGDIANYELNDSFYIDESVFSNNKEQISIQADEQILVGAPSDSILPKYLKNQLREFLKHAGIDTPKAMMIARNYETEENLMQDLVFNFTPPQIADEKKFEIISNTIGWLLPKHYSVLFVDENAVENGFVEI